MTRAQRRAHLVAWALLALVLSGVAAHALWRRHAVVAAVEGAP